MTSYDPTANTWTDGEGNTQRLSDLGSDHLLNIRGFLQRQLRNIPAVVAAVEVIAEQYTAEYRDKDWYSHPEVLDAEEVRGQVKIALMKISQEVNRRGLQGGHDAY